MGKISTESKMDWKNFIDSHPEGNIFQTPEIFEVYKNTKNYKPFVLFTEDSSGITSVLLAVIQKEFSGQISTFTKRAIITGGPLVKNDDPEILNEILKKYVNFIKDKAIFTQVRNLWSWDSFKETFEQNGFEYEEHLDILIDINKNEEELWNSLKSKARNKIRKSIKNDLIISIKEPDDKTIDQVYNILIEVYDKAKIPLADISLFKSSFKFLYKKDMIKLFCAIKDDKIIGFRLGLLYKGKIYDWYAGSYTESNFLNPNDFLPFKTMVWGQQNGFKIFDFGGAGKPDQSYGVRDHKMKFGGELVEYGRFELVHNTYLMEIAKFGLKMFKRFNKVFNTMIKF